VDHHVLQAIAMATDDVPGLVLDQAPSSVDLSARKKRPGSTFTLSVTSSRSITLNLLRLSK